MSTNAIDFEQQRGTLADEQGQYAIVNGKLYTLLPGDNFPYVNNAKLTQNWRDKHLFETQFGALHLTTIKQYSNTIMRVGVLLPTSNLSQHIYVDWPEYKTFDLFTFDSEGLLSIVGLPRLVMKNVRLHHKLFRIMATRALGDMIGYDELIVQGIAYARTRYTTTTTTIANYDITIEQIQQHAEIVSLLAARHHLKINWSSLLHDKAIYSNTGMIKLIIKSLQWAIQKYNPNDLRLDSIIQWVEIHHTHLTNKVWDELEVWSGHPKLVIEGLNKQTGYNNVCTHNVVKGYALGEMCYCCGLPNILVMNYCLNCSANHYCTNCKGNRFKHGSSDEVECLCEKCGCWSKTKQCNLCSLEIIDTAELKPAYTTHQINLTKPLNTFTTNKILNKQIIPKQLLESKIPISLRKFDKFNMFNIVREEKSGAMIEDEKKP